MPEKLCSLLALTISSLVVRFLLDTSLQSINCRPVKSLEMSLAPNFMWISRRSEPVSAWMDSGVWGRRLRKVIYKLLAAETVSRIHSSNGEDDKNFAIV
jgi:hypothetical protein